MKVDLGSFRVNNPGPIVIQRAQLDPAKDQATKAYDAIWFVCGLLLVALVLLLGYRKIRRMRHAKKS